MIWDSCLVRALAEELNATLAGARARAFHFDREGRRVSIYLRESTLIADLSGTGGWITLEEAVEPDPAASPLPAKVLGADAPADERLLFLRFRRIRGRKPDPTLILELATNRWNALWTEGAELKVVKRLRADGRRSRPVGQPWQPPQGDPRAGPGGALTREEWDLLLETEPEEGRRRVLLRSVAHVSSLNVSALTPPVPPGVAYDRWLGMARLQGLDPQVLEGASGPQPYPWPIPGVASTPVQDLFTAFRQMSNSASAPVDWVDRHIDRETERLDRRRRKLEVELEKAGAAEQLREQGNLILASLHLIPAGSAEAQVTGFDGSPQTLKLDPKVKPQAHAETLFKRASRLERATRELPAELVRIKVALGQLESLKTRYHNGAATDDELDKIRQAVNHATAAPKQDPAHAGPYRRYTSSGGLEIRVGRNSRRNDELTFHHARPNDVWLHAQHAAGSHVVLRWVSPDRPPARDLEEAAALAALFSKARGSAHVAVVWTRRKHVRKPKGAPAGTVIPEHIETLFVSPDSALEKRLSEE